MSTERAGSDLAYRQARGIVEQRLNQIEEDSRLLRLFLIMPTGGFAAAATAIVASRMLSLELAGLATFGAGLVGFSLGEGIAIGISCLRSKRFS